MRDAGLDTIDETRGRSRAGGFLHNLEQDPRTLPRLDQVVAEPSWRDCSESTTDVLTADGARAPWGSIVGALVAR